MKAFKNPIFNKAQYIISSYSGKWIGSCNKLIVFNRAKFSSLLFVIVVLAGCKKFCTDPAPEF